jgi:4'-phosphopantetheinyl transferase EntD
MFYTRTLFSRWNKRITTILLLLNVTLNMKQFNNKVMALMVMKIRQQNVGMRCVKNEVVFKTSTNSYFLDSVHSLQCIKSIRTRRSTLLLSSHRISTTSLILNTLHLQRKHFYSLGNNRIKKADDVVPQCSRLYSSSSSSSVPLAVQDDSTSSVTLTEPVPSSIISSTTPVTTTIPTSILNRGYENFIDLELPEGRCIGLKLLDLPAGHPDELTKEAILRYSNTQSAYSMLTIEGEEDYVSLDDISNSNHDSSTTSTTDREHRNNGKKLHWIYEKLHIDEVNYGLSKVKDSIKNQNCFWLGRLAMREGLRLIAAQQQLQQKERHEAAIGAESAKILSDKCIQSISILKDEYGRPRVPNGYLGSISHKEAIGVALISSSSSTSIYNNQLPLQPSADDKTTMNKSTNNVIRRSVGIDIEKRQSTRKSIGRKVLTPYELNDLGQISVSLSFVSMNGSGFADCVNVGIISFLTLFATFHFGITSVMIYFMYTWCWQYICSNAYVIVFRVYLLKKKYYYDLV